MKEQKGVPLFTGDVIRFDQPDGSSPSNRYRVPVAGFHRAGHSVNHHPEDAPYLTDESTSQGTHSQRQPRYPSPVFAGADYGADLPRRASSHTTARRLDRHPLETRVLPRRQFHSGRLLIVGGAFPACHAARLHGAQLAGQLVDDHHQRLDLWSPAHVSDRSRCRSSR